MKFTPRAADPLFDSVEEVARGCGMAILDMSVSRHRGSTQIRLTAYKPGTVGVDDCSRLHRALLPRLELAFPDQDLFVEVSSPGINRVIKDGAEFVHYAGRGVSCYRTDISGWTGGILCAADENSLTIRGKEGTFTLNYENIAKAKLDYSWEV